MCISLFKGIEKEDYFNSHPSLTKHENLGDLREYLYMIKRYQVAKKTNNSKITDQNENVTSYQLKHKLFRNLKDFKARTSVMFRTSYSSFIGASFISFSLFHKHKLPTPYHLPHIYTSNLPMLFVGVLVMDLP